MIMKTISKSIFLVICLLLSGQMLLAQSRSFDDILKLKLKNSGVLMESGQVRGYYYFYTLDKSSEGRRNYLLRIIDENLNDVSSTTIEESKNVALVDAQYNGNQIMLKLLDYQQRYMHYITFDDMGRQIKKSTRFNLNAFEMASYGTRNAPRENNSLTDIPGKGFVEYGLNEKGRGYQITYMPDDRSTSNGWTYSTDLKAKGYQAAGILEVHNDVLYNAVVRKKTIQHKDAEYFLQGLDLQSGQQLFETPLAGEYEHQPLTSYIDNSTGQVNVMGIYYQPGSAVEHDNGMGLFRLSISENGEITDHKYLSWLGDFSRHVATGAKGQMGDDRSYVFFHNIVQNADGSILAVGEQYRRTGDAAGIAVAVLGAMAGYSGASNLTKMVIEDMVIGHFSPDFQIESIQVLEKTKSNFVLPAGYDFMNIHYVAQVINSYGGFDYLFTHKIDHDRATAICYLDHQRQEEGPKKWIFGATTFKDGTFTADKLVLGNAFSEEKIWVMPAKPGYILVSNYLRSEKKLEVHLERINY
jgi:hypothetical protein